MLCEELSFSHICKNCQDVWLKPHIFRRKIYKNIEVFSFYKYKDIKELLHTKHTDLGYYIYNLLANNSFKKFTQSFEFSQRVVSIAIDDNPKKCYSHTAILNNSLKSKHIKPLHGILRAKNEVSYSGKTKTFRMLNQRDFKLKRFTQNNVILVDDIITTGSTLSQAIEQLQKSSKEILFCLTLADASLKL
ncbi:MAG: ComF family protein [Epsilonproteobacteria bacterium]|nr:ComF family protein [Campylobacterota bacterium]